MTTVNPHIYGSRSSFNQSSLNSFFRVCLDSQQHYAGWFGPGCNIRNLPLLNSIRDSKITCSRGLLGPEDTVQIDPVPGESKWKNLPTSPFFLAQSDFKGIEFGVDLIRRCFFSVRLFLLRQPVSRMRCRKWLKYQCFLKTLASKLFCEALEDW